MKRGEIVGNQEFNNLSKVIKKTYSELEAEYLRQLEIKGRREYSLINVIQIIRYTSKSNTPISASHHSYRMLNWVN